MRSVAERHVLRMLARAPRDGFGLGDFCFLRRESRALVRAVAKRLALRSSAGAPPVRAGFDLLHDGGLLKDNGFVHGNDWLNDAVIQRRCKCNAIPELTCFAGRFD